MSIKKNTKIALFSLFLFTAGISSYTYSAPRSNSAEVARVKKCASQLNNAVKDFLSRSDVSALKKAQADLNALDPQDETSKKLLVEIKKYLAAFIAKMREGKKFTSLITQKSQIEKHIKEAFDAFGKQILEMARWLRSLGTAEAAEIACIIERIPPEVEAVERGMKLPQRMRFGRMITNGVDL